MSDALATGILTARDIASRLNCIEYPCRIPRELVEQARSAGLVIVYGASDDLMEFEGAISDEMGCYEGGTAFVDAKGLLDRGAIEEDDDAIADFVLRKRQAKTIKALWDHDGYSWAYEADIPHLTFDVIEDGELYCRGIVFALSDLNAPEAPK